MNEIEQEIIKLCKLWSGREQLNGSLSEDDIQHIIDDGKNGYFHIQDCLFENNYHELLDSTLDYIFESVKEDFPEVDEEVLKEKIEELAEEHLDIGFTIDHMLQDGSNTRYVLQVWDYEDFVLTGNAEDDKEELLALLEHFNINPKLLEEHFNFDPPDIPERNGKEYISLEDMVEIIINSNVTYTYEFFALCNDLQFLIDYEDGPVVVKKGTVIMPHNYFYGASGMNATLIRDMVVENPKFYPDGNYGIERCCGLIPSTWEGELVTIKEIENV